ncbi:tetratricopeptide repeat protein [Bradyrhizobium sp. dw_78]|uniref:tetratricopeptide repeat protein n=1 Tax=Bradyrhizobium sp. dw_78 TaxID=2719793 RepID=UPI001BD346A1
MVLLAGCGTPDENAQTYYKQGLEQVAKHDDVAARGEFLKALKYKADKVDVWRALVGVDERTKAGPASVFGDLRRVVELDPNDLDARLKLAQMMLSGGGADAALKIIETAKEGDKPSAPLHALKALILLRTRDTAGAEREAQRAIAIDPSNIDATVLLASTRTANGDSDSALKMLNALPAQDNDPKISLVKVQAYARKGDLPQAEGLLKKLIADNPKETSLRGQLIQFYIASRDFDDAEHELRTVADAAPANSKAGMDLVRFLMTTKGSKAARSELETRIKGGGDVFDYQIALAEVNFADGDLSQAAQQLQDLANGAMAPERKVAAQARLAEMYVNKGNMAAAEPLIAEILQKDRRNTTGLRLRAAIAIQKEQFDSAIADLREALNDQPKSPDLLMLMATAYERSGKTELAERQYADALKVSGQNSDIALQYIAFLQRRSDLAHAEDVLNQVLTQNSRDTRLLAALAQLRLARQNWTGAMAVADAISKRDNGRVLSDEIRASALAGQNRIDESLSALEDAHAAIPDAVQPIGSLVTSYLKFGKADKAETLLQQMLKKFPDNAEFLVWMGQTKLAQNKPDDASQDFKTAMAKQPKDSSGYHALSDLYTRQKNYDGAMQVIQAGLKEQPDNINLRLTSAALEILKGDPGTAVSQYETLIKDQPNSPVVINNLASLILDSRSDKESLDRGIALAEKLKGASLPQFQDTYGWAQFKKGDYKSAIAILEPVVSSMSNSAVVHYHLGMSYAANGDTAKAGEQFKAALALEPDGTPLKTNILAAMK